MFDVCYLVSIIIEDYSALDQVFRVVVLINDWHESQVNYPMPFQIADQLGPCNHQVRLDEMGV